MKALFTDTITGLSLRLKDPSGRQRTEHLSLFYGKTVRLGSAPEADVLIVGRFIAPFHFTLSHDRYCAYVHVLEKGFPVAVNGRVYGQGSVVTLTANARLKSGETEAFVSIEKNKHGWYMKLAMAAIAALVILAPFLYVVHRVQANIADFHSLTTRAEAAADFRQQVSLLSEANAILDNSTLTNWFANQETYHTISKNTLYEKYFLTDVDSSSQRQEVLRSASKLAPRFTALHRFYNIEQWGNLAVRKNNMDTLPVLNPISEPAEQNPSLQACVDFVKLIDQTGKLQRSGQTEAGIALIRQCPMLNGNFNLLHRFFKPAVLYRYSDLLADRQAINTGDSTRTPDEFYSKNDPDFKYCSEKYKTLLNSAKTITQTPGPLKSAKNKILPRSPNKKHTANLNKEVRRMYHLSARGLR